MITVFEKIPDWFIEKYDREICEWARNFAKIGPVKSIILREGQFSDVSPDPEQGAVLMQVKLIARMERLRDRVTISPYDERDAELIAKHCRKMEALRVSPRMILREPDRPWLPFMPKVVGPGRLN